MSSCLGSTREIGGYFLVEDVFLTSSEGFLHEYIFSSICLHPRVPLVVFLSDTGLLTPHPPTTHPFHCSPISPSIFLSRLLACCCFCSMNPRYHDAVRISQMFSASVLRSVFRTSISHTFIFVFVCFACAMPSRFQSSYTFKYVQT